MNEESINRPIVTWDDAASAAEGLPPDQRELAEELIGTARVGAADTVAAAGAGPWLLGAISVRGHAGIGEQPVELRLTAARGLTIVSAPNGTGKTSFVDGLRLGLGAALSSDQGILAGNIHWAQRSITATVTTGARDVNIVSDGRVVSWAEAAGDSTA